jgi:ribosome recycling factor
MEYKKIVEKTKPEMEKVISYFTEEMKRIRADRATPSVVEDIVINCFDQKMPLKQLASISCPEKRQILIEPWDKNYIKDIISAVQKSEADLGVSVGESSIRVSLPPLTQEYRESLLKIVAEKKEGVRVSLRRAREDAWKEIQDKFQEKEIKEDEKFKGKEELQDLIDQYNKKIDEITKKKEEEIKI